MECELCDGDPHDKRGIVHAVENACHACNTATVATGRKGQRRTMDFGGRSFLKRARTTPTLPCARATCRCPCKHEAVYNGLWLV